MAAMMLFIARAVLMCTSLQSALRPVWRGRCAQPGASMTLPRIVHPMHVAKELAAAEAPPRIPLRPKRPKRPPRRWRADGSDVIEEVERFIERFGEKGVMPTRLLFEKHDRRDLVNAIQSRFGGTRKLAQRLGLSMGGRHAERQWSLFSVVKAELEEFARVNGTVGVMPASLELRRHGRTDLLAAIILHGGLRKVCAKTDMRLRPAILARRTDWADWDVVSTELLEFIAANGTAGLMPYARELRAHGKESLLYAIHSYHGGQRTVGERLGLRVRSYERLTASPPRPKGYWHDDLNILRELLPHARAATARELEAARADGRTPVVPDYGQSAPPSNVSFFAAAYAAGGGNASACFGSEAWPTLVMPTQAELYAAGRSDLHRAISQRGGYFEIAELFGFARADGKVRRRWAERAVVEEELRAYIAVNGTEGVMPSHGELALAGRTDLLSAIARHHGSMHLVAERMGLRLHDGYSFRDWLQFDNLAREMRLFLAERAKQGFPPDVMPTSFELRNASRYDLHSAVRQHRGFYNVARRLRLRTEGGYDSYAPGRGGAMRAAYGRGRRLSLDDDEDDDDEYDGAANDEDARRAEAEMLRALRREFMDGVTQDED